MGPLVTLNYKNTSFEEISTARMAAALQHRPAVPRPPSPGMYTSIHIHVGNIILQISMNKHRLPKTAAVTHTMDHV